MNPRPVATALPMFLRPSDALRPDPQALRKLAGTNDLGGALSPLPDLLEDRGGLPDADVVPAPEFQGVQAELRGEDVHRHFEGEVPLRRPVPPVRPGHGEVRVHGLPVEAKVLRLVVEGQGLRSDVAEDGQGVGPVGAGVGERLHFVGAEDPVFRGPQPHRDPHRVAGPAGHEHLFPGVGHPHRPSGPQGERRGHRLQDDLLFRTESPPDPGFHDPDARWGDLEHAGHDPPHVERDLGRAAQHEAAVLVEVGDHAVGLDRGVLGVRDRARRLDGHRGVRQGVGHVPHRDVHRRGDVRLGIVDPLGIRFVVDHGRPRRQGFLRGQGRGEDLVLDHDLAEGLVGRTLGLRRHRRHLVPHEPDLSVEEEVVVRGGLRPPLAGRGVGDARDVPVVEDAGHARHLLRFRGVQRQDLGVGVGGAEDLPHQDPGEIEVEGELGLAGDEGRPVHLPRVLAHLPQLFLYRHVPPLFHSAASSTASTILT